MSVCVFEIVENHKILSLNQSPNYDDDDNSNNNNNKQDSLNMKTNLEKNGFSPFYKILSSSSSHLISLSVMNSSHLVGARIKEERREKIVMSKVMKRNKKNNTIIIIIPLSKCYCRHSS